MMTSIVALMEGLATRLATIPGLRVKEYDPDNPMPPQAIVGVPPVDDYQEAIGRGKYTVSPTVTVLTSKALDRAGQMKLAGYVSLTGEQSIPAAVHADRTLGGVCDDIVVVSFRPLGPQEVAQVSYYGGLFVLRAMVTEQT